MHNFFVWKYEGKKTLRRPTRRWEINIRTDLRKIEWEVVGCIPLAQDRDKWWAFVNTFGEFLD